MAHFVYNSGVQKSLVDEGISENDRRTSTKVHTNYIDDTTYTVQ